MNRTQTVTHLHTTTRPAKKRPKAYKIDEHVMNDLRLRMYDYDVQDMMDATGLSRGCIYNIRNGKTKWPRGATFFAVLRLLEIEMHLYDTRRGTYL